MRNGKKSFCQIHIYISGESVSWCVTFFRIGLFMLSRLFLVKPSLVLSAFMFSKQSNYYSMYIIWICYVRAVYTRPYVDFLYSIEKEGTLLADITYNLKVYICLYVRKYVCCWCKKFFSLPSTLRLCIYHSFSLWPELQQQCGYIFMASMLVYCIWQAKNFSLLLCTCLTLYSIFQSFKREILKVYNMIGVWCIFTSVFIA